MRPDEVLIGCLDFESTGVSVEKDRIIEIGLVVVDLTGRERLAYEKRINPQMHIAAGATGVHGITDADVMRCDTFDTVARGLAAMIGRLTLLVGHNIARFDLPLLAHELVRVKVSPPAFPEVFDTMLHGRGATDDGKIPTLGELCYALDVPYDKAQAHAALYDVRVNLQAFLRGWKLGHFQVPALDQMKEAA